MIDSSNATLNSLNVKEDRIIMLEDTNEAKQATSNVMMDSSNATLNSLNAREERTITFVNISKANMKLHITVQELFCKVLF